MISLNCTITYVFNKQIDKHIYLFPKRCPLKYLEVNFPQYTLLSVVFNEHDVLLDKPIVAYTDKDEIFVTIHLGIRNEPYHTQLKYIPKKFQYYFVTVLEKDLKEQSLNIPTMSYAQRLQVELQNQQPEYLAQLPSYHAPELPAEHYTVLLNDINEKEEAQKQAIEEEERQQREHLYIQQPPGLFNNDIRLSTYGQTTYHEKYGLPSKTQPLAEAEDMKEEDEEEDKLSQLKKKYIGTKPMVIPSAVSDEVRKRYLTHKKPANSPEEILTENSEEPPKEEEMSPVIIEEAKKSELLPVPYIEEEEEPSSKLIPLPEVEPVVEPEVEPVMEPVMEPQPQPVVEPQPQPVVEPVVEPTPPTILKSPVPPVVPSSLPPPKTTMFGQSPSNGPLSPSQLRQKFPQMFGRAPQPPPCPPPQVPSSSMPKETQSSVSELRNLGKQREAAHMLASPSAEKKQPQTLPSPTLSSPVLIGDPEPLKKQEVNDSIPSLSLAGSHDPINHQQESTTYVLSKTKESLQEQESSTPNTSILEEGMNDNQPQPRLSEPVAYPEAQSVKNRIAFFASRSSETSGLKTPSGSTQNVLFQSMTNTKGLPHSTPKAKEMGLSHMEQEPKQNDSSRPSGVTYDSILNRFSGDTIDKMILQPAENRGSYLSNNIPNYNWNDSLFKSILLYSPCLWD